MIASLFDAPHETQEQHGVERNTTGDIKPDVTRSAEVEAAVLRAKIEGMETTINLLRDQLDQLKAERDRLLAMLEAEQQQRQVYLLDRGRGSGWFRRLFQRGSGDGTGGK